MKTVIKTTWTAARRGWLLFQVRSLETQCDGMADALDVVRDPLTRQRITTARDVARRELARVRAEYSALLPVGLRVVWEAA